MDWQAFLFNPEAKWLTRFEAIARRRFRDVNLADQALEQALEKLQANNWARLNTTDAISSHEGFLLCVYRHLIEDFAVARFGKCRAPVWVQDLGAIWSTLYKRLCCERQLPDAVAERLLSAEHSVDTLIKMCRILKARIPQCGSQIHFETIDGEDSAELSASREEAPDSVLESADFNNLLMGLSALFDTNSASNAKITAPSALLSKFVQWDRKLGFDPDTQLLLKMVFQDDFKVAKAAAILGMAEHTARRNLKKALSQMRAELNKAGFEAGDYVD